MSVDSSKPYWAGTWSSTANMSTSDSTTILKTSADFSCGHKVLNNIARRLIGSTDALPEISYLALMLYTNLWEKATCVYILMQKGLGVMPIHRDCQHSKADSGECKRFTLDEL
jgi:hypothetical protein